MGPKPKPIGKADWLDLEAEQDHAVWDIALNSDIHTKLLIHFELHLGMRRSGVLRSILPYNLGKHMIVHGKGKHGGKFRTIPTHPFTGAVLKEMADYRQDTLEPLAAKYNPPVP